MAVYQTRPWKRGDIYYVTYDNAIGSEMATGRPAIIVSSEKECGTNNVLSVVYLTSRETHADFYLNVEINSTSRKSWAICNQVCSVDKIRCKNYCATATEAEMAAVDRALAMALGLPYGVVTDDSAVAAVRAELAETEAELRKKENEVFGMIAERDYYKRLYDAALGRFVYDRLDYDLSNPPQFTRVPRMIPDEPEEEETVTPVEVVEPKPLIDLNTCSAADLKKAGMKEDMILRVIGARPFKKVEDLRNVQGVTKIAWQLLQHKVTVVEPVAKVNINTASGKEIAKALGVSDLYGYTITGYRNRNGLYQSLDELENVPKLTNRLREKALEVLTV